MLNEAFDQWFTESCLHSELCELEVETRFEWFPWLGRHIIIVNRLRASQIFMESNNRRLPQRVRVIDRQYITLCQPGSANAMPFWQLRYVTLR